MPARLWSNERASIMPEKPYTHRHRQAYICIHTYVCASLKQSVLFLLWIWDFTVFWVEHGTRINSIKNAAALTVEKSKVSRLLLSSQLQLEKSVCISAVKRCLEPSAPLCLLAEFSLLSWSESCLEFAWLSDVWRQMSLRSILGQPKARYQCYKWGVPQPSRCWAADDSLIDVETCWDVTKRITTVCDSLWATQTQTQTLVYWVKLNYYLLIYAFKWLL